MPSILIVDDSKAEQFLNRALLKKMDPTLEVLVAFDGQEALQTLKGLASPPLLILLDINMPGMDGHEFLEEYAKLQRTIPVVVMLTSSDQAEDRRRALGYSFVRNYLNKPLNPANLEAIQATLEQVRA